MVQAARSGKQNIAEGSQTSGTSKKSELRLVDVARASLEELKIDYEDFLRINNLKRWDKNDSRVLAVRELAYRTNKSYMTYSSYVSSPELAANCALCIINQTNYLLDRQIHALTDAGAPFESHGQRLARILAEKEKRERETDEMIAAVLTSAKKDVK